MAAPVTAATSPRGISAITINAGTAPVTANSPAQWTAASETRSGRLLSGRAVTGYGKDTACNALATRQRVT
jgi:hypothetical protein